MHGLHLLKRLLILLTLLLLAACAPRTQSASDASSATTLPSSYVGSTFDGSTQTVAIVVEGTRTSGLSDDLRDALYNETLSELRTHPFYRPRFVVVERNRLQSALDELALGASGVVDVATAPQLGNLLGASYILYVELLQASAEPVGVSGLRLPGIGNRTSVSGYDVTLAVGFNLVEVETGAVIGVGRGTEAGFVGSGVAVGSQRISGDARTSALLERVSPAVFRAADALARDADGAIETATDTGL